jgi:hypothetical protein
MQVADIQQEATTATLGAQETTAVELVDDAAFLIMMSTNLYSNQKLAMVREVLCNAWDANIEAGTTDTPLKVTITDKFELVIEDSGLGIPHDKFPKVYGTVGGSTKKTNLMVTGGFGLGAKSPWAYVESFRVINEHAGIKTVNNLVKASVEAEGRPAIQCVTSMPTERSGLTVRIQMEQKDVEVIVLYIRYVAMHGDMLVDFTRQDATIRLERIEMDTTPGTYNVASDKWHAHYMGNHKLFVRYGAVIYPMLQTPGTQKAVDVLLEFMEIIGFSRMVVQAAPGTLALTPSREALSSSKMTEDGITDLCVSLVARIEEDLIAQVPGSITEAINDLEKGVNRSVLDGRADVWQYVNPYAVRRYLQSPLGTAKRAKHHPELLAAEHRGFKATHTFSNRSATIQYHRMRTRIKAASYGKSGDILNWFKNHYVMRPLGKVFFTNKALLKLENLRYSANHYHDRKIEAKEFVRRHMNADFRTLKDLIDDPVVFVTSRLKDLPDSIDCCPEIRSEQAVWVYKIATGDKDREAIIKAFEDGGFEVVDLTLNHDWDDVAQELIFKRDTKAAEQKANRPAGAPAVAKSKNQLISLSALYNEQGKRKMKQHDAKTLTEHDATTDTPLFFLELDDYKATGKIGLFAYYVDLTEDERKHGVIVRSGTERNMAVKRGAQRANAYFAQRFFDAALSEEYKRYATQLRKPSLPDDHFITSTDLKLFDTFGIKLPGYEKLTFDPKMERLRQLVKDVNSSTIGACISAEVASLVHYSMVVQQYKLDELPFIKKLKTMQNDRLLQKLGRGEGILELLAENPERKAALKSLVQLALKSGTKK